MASLSTGNRVLYQLLSADYVYLYDVCDSENKLLTSLINIINIPVLQMSTINIKK